MSCHHLLSQRYMQDLRQLATNFIQEWEQQEGYQDNAGQQEEEEGAGGPTGGRDFPGIVWLGMVLPRQVALDGLSARAVPEVQEGMLSTPELRKRQGKQNCLRRASDFNTDLTKISRSILWELWSKDRPYRAAVNSQDDSKPHPVLPGKSRPLLQLPSSEVPQLRPVLPVDECLKKHHLHIASRNQSIITEFILLGLSANPHVQALLFVLFLKIYLLTLLGNLTMMLVIRADSHLHTPMYFFLSHLSLVDLCFSSVTVPKMLNDLLSEKKTISVEGCLTQIFFVFLTAGTEIFLVSMMAFDRYVAICNPLLYGQIMSSDLCTNLIWVSWALSFLDAVINTLPAVNLNFCDAHVIPHYSCELPSLFPLSCSDVSTSVTVLICSTLLHGFGTFFLIFFSYIHIISTILSIRSTTGRSKAFATCSSHLSVVSFFYGSAFLRYLIPTSGSSLELIFSIQYGVVTPLMNFLIYSLNNKEVKRAMRRTLGRYLQAWVAGCRDN
ncbi:olfactory receptor 8S1-like [Ctenodactylus gundi]